MALDAQLLLLEDPRAQSGTVGLVGATWYHGVEKESDTVSVSTYLRAPFMDIHTVKSKLFIRSGGSCRKKQYLVNRIKFRKFL